MTPAGGSARVLVIEPDATLRYLLVRALDEHHYTVLATGNLELAGELLEASLGIQLVVTNLRLDFGGHVDFLDTIERSYASVPILHLMGPLFQKRGALTPTGFNIDRFIAAVRHCLTTGRCDPPPEERRPASYSASV